jgi:hypothetical protein
LLLRLSTPEACFHKTLTQSGGAGPPRERPSYGVCFPAAQRDFLIFIASGLAVVENVLANNSRNSGSADLIPVRADEHFRLASYRNLPVTV